MRTQGESTLLADLTLAYLGRMTTLKGDAPGHPFRGNQFGSGSGGSSKYDPDKDWGDKKSELATAAKKRGFENEPGRGDEYFKVIHGSNDYGPTKTTHTISANKGSGKFSHRISLQHVTPLGPNSTGGKFGPFDTAEEAFHHAERTINQ